MRVTVLVIGPFTSLLLLVKTISTPLFGVPSAITAYALGVVIMGVINLSLIRYKRMTQDTTVNTRTNGIIQALALSITSLAFLSNITIQLLHITGMRQMFLVAFGLTTLRIQQTLGGGKTSAIFSGPVSLITFTLLVVLWGITKVDDETFQHPEPLTHRLTQTPAFIVCFFIGAAAHVHILCLLFNQRSEPKEGKPSKWFAVGIASVHIVLVILSGLIQKTHPFTVDVPTVRLNESVEHVMPRLVMSITLLLLCTAPIVTSGVFNSIFVDGSVIIATVLITNTSPHIGSVALIVFSAVKVIAVFCLTYLFTDEWIPKFIWDNLRSVKSSQ